MNRHAARSAAPTVGGFLAILFWGSNIAFTRVLTEKLGLFTSAVLVFGLGGGLPLVYLRLRRPGAISRMVRLPRAYLLGCGALFVVYLLCFYSAIGAAATRQQVLEVAIVNYFWPSLTLALAAPLLNMRAKWPLPLGMLLACTGIVAAMMPEDLSWSATLENVRSNGSPYLLAIGCAVSWALYSNLSRRLAGKTEGDAVPLFLLASALGFALIRLFVSERTEWTPRVGFELAYTAMFPTFIAYTLWENAMRRGRTTLVAAASYLTPILSTLISCVYLRVAPGATLWLAAGLVMTGAVICSFSIAE